MLIGLCGGICTGKTSIANFLVSEHGFKRVHLVRTAATPLVEKSASNAHVPDDEEPTATNSQKLTFSDIHSLVAFVTTRWKERWVMEDVWDEGVLEVLSRRPFFLLVSVDAPVSVRWQRFKDRCAAHALTPPELGDFVLRNDEHLYSEPGGLAPLLQRAQIRLFNGGRSREKLHEALNAVDLLNESRLRPSWDQYFMQLASLAAQRSNCMKRRVGCVLIRDKRVLSTGYNGTPRNLKNCNEGGCPRCNDGQHAGTGLEACLCIHAEENALLEAGRERIRGGSILYCDTCPCLTCTIKITQVGISEVVYSQAYSMDHRAAAIFEEGGVKLRQFSPQREGLIDLGTAPMAAM